MFCLTGGARLLLSALYLIPIGFKLIWSRLGKVHDILRLLYGTPETVGSIVPSMTPDNLVKRYYVYFKTHNKVSFSTLVKKKSKLNLDGDRPFSANARPS